MYRFLPVFLTLFLLSNFAFAQQDGLWAPNFTVTDIDGNTHRLYDYLADGKTVILDFAATWCGPCWDEHQTNVLKDIYNTYGPEGTDEVMVLFVESDPDTGMPQLDGSMGPSQGNWIEGTPYPIIDLPEQSIPNAYNVIGYPTIYVVCPDLRVLTDIWSNEWSMEFVMDHINDCEGLTPPAEDGQLHAYPLFNMECDEVNISATLTNGGTIPLVFAQLRIWNQGEELNTIIWTGNLALGEEDIVDFGTYPLGEGTNDFSLELMLVDEDQTNNYTQVPWIKAPVSTNELIIYLETDESAEEDNTRWFIEDENGTIVAESPALNNDDYTETMITLDGDGCYSFTVLDDGNDGVTNGFLTIGDSNDEIIYSSTDFGREDGTLINVGGTVNTVSFEDNHEINLYPNPVGDLLSVAIESIVSTNEVLLEVVDLTGRVVQRQKEYQLDRPIEINTAALPAGIYLLNFRIDGQLLSRKFVKQ